MPQLNKTNYVRVAPLTNLLTNPRELQLFSILIY